MGEAGTLMKIVMGLGLILLLAGLMYSGAESGWDNFSSSVNNFPTFNNPFGGPSVLSFTLGLASGGTGYSSILTAHGSAEGCAQATYWNCLTDPKGPDGDRTFVEISDSISQEQYLSVNLTGWPSVGTIRDAIVTIRCRSNDAISLQIRISVQEWISVSGGSGNTYLQSINENAYCTTGDDFNATFIHLQPPGTISDLSSNTFPPNLQMWIRPPFAKSISISTVAFTATVAAETGCTGGDFFSNTGCQLGRLADTIIKAFIFVYNGFIFIGQVFAYVGGVLSSFFGMLTFLFHIPGTPDFVQSIISIGIIGLIVWFIFVAIGIFRGSSLGV